MITGRMESTLITILSLYAPPGSNRFFFKTLINLIASESKGIFICGGDFNVLFNPKLDSSNFYNHTMSPVSRQINNAKRTGID